MSKIIAVFGSARTQPDHPVYSVGYDVGKTLAQAGYITMTGGYAGVMEAASKGAAEANGDVHGVTVESLEAIGESRTNQWVRKEYRYPNLRTRIQHLIDKADAYVVMPGGIGTVQEFIEVWQSMRLGDLQPKPLLFHKTFWMPIVQQLLDHEYIDEQDVEYLIPFETADAMMAALTTWFDDEEADA